MKRLVSGFSLLAVAALFVVACKKPTPNVVPEPDTETQTAVDASWATFVITDIEMQCAFMGENVLLTHFYTDVPGTAVGNQGTITATRDTLSRTLNMGWNKTTCIDGRFRDGTVFMRYGGFSGGEVSTFFPNNGIDSRYTHSYGFGGMITLSEYKVDGWKVETVDGTPATLYNLSDNKGFDPAVKQLKWRLKGKFKFTHPTDSSLNMWWEGDLIKTCINSTDKKNVWYADKLHNKDSAVKWRNAKVTYSGTMTGITSKGHAFSMKVDTVNPIMRDFTCYPYLVGGVVLSPTVTIRKQEFHPFISGIASFTTTDDKGTVLYPRQIYYGNEGASVDGVTTAPCDNTAEVYIKGITYRINLLQ